MSFEFVAIDDICELVRGSSPRPQGDPRFFGGSVPRLMVADMTRDGMYVTPSIDSLTEEGARQSRPMKAGELVMVVSGVVGLPSILKIDACIHDGLVGFRNLDKKVLPEYLYYWLLGSQEKSRAQTSGAIWQNLTTDQIKEWKLPLLPLTEQKRITSLLARADRLRQLRRTAHDLGDALLQSVFLEMFGDGFGKWKVDLLENLTEKIDYGVTASAVFKPVGSKFLRITDIQEGKVNWDDVPYCEISEKERDSSLLSKGDIVFARTGATTGKSFLIHDCPENSVFASYRIRVRPIEELNPVFLFGYFQTAQYWKQISESATGSTQPGVNSTKLGELKVPVPPLSLQEEFAGVVARVESLRGRMGESARQVEGLFESLLAESFGGINGD